MIKIPDIGIYSVKVVHLKDVEHVLGITSSVPEGMKPVWHLLLLWATGVVWLHHSRIHNQKEGWGWQRKASSERQKTSKNKCILCYTSRTRTEFYIYSFHLYFTIHLYYHVMSLTCYNYILCHYYIEIMETVRIIAHKIQKTKLKLRLRNHTIKLRFNSFKIF